MIYPDLPLKLPADQGRALGRRRNLFSIRSLLPAGRRLVPSAASPMPGATKHRAKDFDPELGNGKRRSRQGYRGRDGPPSKHQARRCGRVAKICAPAKCRPSAAPASPEGRRRQSGHRGTG